MNTLTYNYVNGLKPAESKNYRKYDWGGLYIEVRPNGSKLWCFKYVYNKKSKLLSFGKFPDVSLKEASGLVNWQI